MKVNDVMSKPAVTCSKDEHLGAAAKLMWDHDCGVLPVVDGDGRLVGIITDRDICMAAWTRGCALSAIRVEDAMAKEVFSVGPEETIKEVEHIMATKQVHRVPVVDEESRPIGVLSMNDLAREATDGGRMKDGVTRALRTLAAICRPRPHHAPAA